MTSANFVDVQHHVDDVASCHELCNIFENINCNYFTYYNDENEFPNLCFLYNDCTHNNTDCAGCFHGPRERESAFLTWKETEDGTCNEQGNTVLQ